MLHAGKLINNFVYSPGRSVSPSTWLVARDIHHAASVCRRFYWSILNLWPHQLPRNSLIVLSGRDQLVPVQVINSMRSTVLLRIGGHISGQLVDKNTQHKKTQHSGFGHGLLPRE